jgi:Fe-S cluster assembly scaffold protein SufB
LQSYEEFVKESEVHYQQLPQEGSELYKRYYINIPFDLTNSLANADPYSEEMLKNVIGDWSSKLGVKFDFILGSTSSFMTNPSEFIKIENAQSDGSANSVMHSSSEDKYVAFINAYSQRRVIIDIPEGKTANINMLLFNSNKPLNVRVFLKLGKDAKLNLFEYYGSFADKPTSLGTIHEADLKDGAALELNALHNENQSTIILSYCKNTMGENSHLRFNSLYNGGTHTRVRNVIEADKKESKVEVSEIVFGSADQKFDINTYIVNAASHTHASLESKAALMDTSFCILKGFAKIRKGATKARSYVHERGILLDKGAKVNGLPDMSVDENDVKATHSSATSPVDQESVFYLMSKGIDETGVRKLLVKGFFAESLSKIHNTLMKELSMSLINSKLENKAYGATPSRDIKDMWVGGAATETDMFKGHYKYRGTE